jgi:hypothetical protein
MVYTVEYWIDIPKKWLPQKRGGNCFGSKYHILLLVAGIDTI